LSDGDAVSWGLDKTNDESECSNKVCDWTKTSTGLVSYLTYLTALDWDAKSITGDDGARHTVEFDVAYTSDACEAEVSWTQHSEKEASQDFWRHRDILFVMGESGLK